MVETETGGVVLKWRQAYPNVSHCSVFPAVATIHQISSVSQDEELDCPQEG